MVQRARPDRVYGSQSSPQRARPGGLECHDLKPFRVLIFPTQRVDPVIGMKVPLKKIVQAIFKIFPRLSP